MKYEASYDYLVKVLMIGESGVGKSCLISRFNKNEFSTSHLATIAIDFKMKLAEIDGKRVKMQIWDTAGQERFATLTNGFFKGSDGILIVYSISDVKSFENVNKWMTQVHSRAPTDVKIILVGNKSDLEETRKVSFEEGERLASKYGIPFYETSAKSGHNVNEVFKKLGSNIIEAFALKKQEMLTSESQNGSTVDIKTQSQNSCC